MRDANHGSKCSEFAALNPPGEVHNNNNGDGPFYQSTGPQYIFHCLHPSAHLASEICNEELEVRPSGEAPPSHVPSLDSAVPEFEVPQPYQTTIDSLSHLQRQFSLLSQVFPHDSSVVKLHSLLNGFSTVVSCAGRAVAVIRRVSPKLLSHSFFTTLEKRAFQCVAQMKALERRIPDHDIVQHTRSRECDRSSRLCTWPSLSYDTQRCIRNNRRFLYAFLRFITNPEFLRIIRSGGGELKYIIRDLAPPEDLHHYSVDTIWVRKPTGMDWYGIPLAFCQTWTDFAIVLYHCFINGPEVDYIRRGSFEMIHNHDIVDAAVFSQIIRPEMRFDIGIIMQLLSSKGWIRCANLECDTQFRAVISPPPELAPISDLYEKKSLHAAFPGQRKVYSSLRQDEPVQSQGPTSGSIRGPESPHPHFAKFHHVSARICIATRSSDEEQSIYEWHGGRSVLCVAFAGDGDIILSSSYTEVMIWYRSAKQGRTVTFDSRTIPSAVDAVALSPTGSQFATGRRGRRVVGKLSGGTVQVWDVATQKVVRTLQGHTTTIQSLAFSPNESKLASGSWHGEIQVWDLKTGGFILIKAHNDDWVCSLAFSPDGSCLLSGSADTTARVWDAHNGKLLRVLSGHTNELNSVAFSADSTLVVSGSDDRTVRIWKTETGEVIQTLGGHSDWIHCVAISPDQRRIASGSDDGTVRLWDASSGEVLDVYDLRDRLWSIAFSPDSKSVISGTYHGKVHIRKMEH